MTINEAILKSLEDLQEPSSSVDVYTHILSKNYYLSNGKTFDRTVASNLSQLVANGDTRVKRYKQVNGTHLYYLTGNEQNVNENILKNERESQIPPAKNSRLNTYEERDLHKLLSTYLNSVEINCKTIFHEQSNGKDNNQIWTHPDMVGIKFLKLNTIVSQSFFKSINRVDTFKISSYELKKELHNDTELKKAFFQAVSNSSWANYGYLVAFEFSDTLYEEMARLNQSFGIGIIELNVIPYQSKILFPATYRDLDFRTIDKLCKINDKFSEFIEHTEKLMTADKKYESGVKRELDLFCDDYFRNEEEIIKYCQDKHIPLDGLFDEE